MTIRTIEMRRGSEYPEPLLYFKLCIKECHYLIDVFVSPSGEVHDYYFVFWKALCKLDCVCYCVGTFKGRYYAFFLGKYRKGFKSLGIGRHDILRSARILVEAVLGAYARIVQPGSYGVDGEGHSVFVLKIIALESVYETRHTLCKGGGVVGSVKTFSCRFDSDYFDLLVVVERIEKAYCVASSSDACDHKVRQTVFLFQYLISRFFAYYALKFPYHYRVGMGTYSRAEKVEGCFGIFNKIVKSSVYRFFESPVSVCHRNDLCSQKLHAVDIEGLALSVFFTHEYYAFHTEKCACCCCCNSVLSCAGFCNYSFLSHTLSQKGLPDCVVYFMGACVVEVFAFQVYLGASGFFGEAFGIVQRVFSAYVFLLIIGELLLKIRIFNVFEESVFKLFENCFEGRGNNGAAVISKISVSVFHFISSSDVGFCCLIDSRSFSL